MGSSGRCAAVFEKSFPKGSPSQGIICHGILLPNIGEELGSPGSSDNLFVPGSSAYHPVPTAATVPTAETGQKDWKPKYFQTFLSS